jgi:NADPH:quinone reductase-like Zn-dependent oxidoreductase
MKKIVIHGPGDYRKLKIEEHSVSETKDNEVLIKVSFIGINYADILIRWGVYSSAKEYVGWPITPGFEVSGVVEKVGSKVTHVKVGDKVFGVTRFGGYSTQINIQEDFVFPVPKNLTMEQAAAFPSVYLTAFHALFQNIVIRPHSKILIHSCAGGVGSALLQLCRHYNFETTGIVGSTHKIENAKAWGANHVIDKSTQNLWREAEIISPSGYDVILDANGAETLKESFNHLAPCGKLICYGFHSMFKKQGGKLNYMKLIKTYLQTPRFNPLDMTAQNKSLVTFNLSYLFDKKDIFEEGINNIITLFENGSIQGPLVTVFPFEKVAEAHSALESGKTTGKIVLKC